MPKKINILPAEAGVMTDRIFNNLWKDAIAAPDEDAFLAAAECPDADLITVRDQLRRLWHVAHDNFRDFLAALNMTQTAISVHFCIPFSSVQNWACEMRVCPPYLRLMMAEAMGYITLRSMHP